MVKWGDKEAGLTYVRNYSVFTDKENKRMQALASQILESTKGTAEGRVYTAREFLHLGKRPAVDQALSRLTKEGASLRIARGRYVLPVKTRFGWRAPSPALVVESFARMTGENVATSGAVAANELGLTTQVPIRSVFLTSGKSRHLRVGKQVIEMKHAATWRLKAPGETTGNAIRALTWLGRPHAARAIAHLQETLSVTEKEQLLAARAAQIPTWLAQELSKLSPEKGEIAR
jgi:hypothetical protein